MSYINPLFRGSVALCALLLSNAIRAQAPDPNVKLEAAAVRAEVAKNIASLRHYTWTEHVQVLVKGDVKSERTATCRYNADDELVKRPAGAASEQTEASGISKRPMVRKKADMEDYIERAVSMIHEYVPPQPKSIDYVLNSGLASFRKAADGNSEIVLKNYYQQGDSLVFTYEPNSKRLLRAVISSALGGPKDPITLEAVFATLPDGVNHLASATLNAPKKKVQIKASNTTYQKTD